MIREIRSFAPDLVLTHRTCDYHPDHRAVGQLVQDASYLVTVPNVLREVPALRKDPVVAYMADTFSKPCRMVPDAVLDATGRLDTIIAMLACHRSQVFEWLPYEEDVLGEVPADDAEKLVWLRGWYLKHARRRADWFRRELIAAFGPQRGSGNRGRRGLRDQRIRLSPEGGPAATVVPHGQVPGRLRERRRRDLRVRHAQRP